MTRLPESKDILDTIKEKALRNAILRGTYRTRAVFRSGKTILSFSEEFSDVSKQAMH